MPCHANMFIAYNAVPDLQSLRAAERFAMEEAGVIAYLTFISHFVASVVQIEYKKSRFSPSILPT